MSARKSNKSVKPVQSDKTEGGVQSTEPVVVEPTEPVVPVVVGPTEAEIEATRIEKENKVVDLEAEIVKVSERLAELKKELRGLTKTKGSKKEGPTKMELATQLWKDNPGLARKDYVAKFMSELGLTLAGSRTYVQIIMTKNK